MTHQLRNPSSPLAASQDAHLRIEIKHKKGNAQGKMAEHGLEAHVTDALPNDFVGRSR
jgi:hypothetical protein